MPSTILKRDGTRERFQGWKIEDAVIKAFRSVGAAFDPAVVKEVISRIGDSPQVAVEEIQDLIERSLFESGRFEVMRSFITYRFLHKMQREHVYGLRDDTTYVDCTQTIEEYINGQDWRILANSNTGYSHAGLVNNSAGKVIANFWLDRVYSQEEGMAHRVGDYHIHDLDCLSGYCAGWSLRQLLDEGFNGVRGRVSARPPRHLREALSQMANFLGILQSEWAGAQAFSSFDTYLAPYLFLDDLTEADVLKAVRSFVYNLNVPARWGQSPFTNITIDWTVPEDLAEQWPTSRGIHLFEGLADEALAQRAAQRCGVADPAALRYRHFLPEMRRIVKAFYTVMTEGDSTGQPFTFPIPTVNITEDFDWHGENTDLLFENTARIGSSYFQNFVGSQYKRDAQGNRVADPDSYKPNAVRSMCCRLQLDLRELLKRGGGLFGSAEMTGSVGVVTLNMARLGYRFQGDREGLFNKVDYLMDLARSTLEKKRAFITELYQRGLFPYTRRYLPGFRNHFSTIGVNGINEMIRNFSGDTETVATATGRALAADLLDHMRERIRGYQEATGNLYNLEATPAEGTTYRFAKEDHKRYPEMLQAGQAPNIYYTNSSQLPVDYTDDPFEALDLQDELQCKYTGGTVLHLYMSERMSTAEACRRLVRRVVENHRLPYITITPLFSVCEKHGYLPGEHTWCPHCDEDVLRQHRDECDKGRERDPAPDQEKPQAAATRRPEGATAA